MAAYYQEHVGLIAQRPHRLLTILRGIADVFLLRTHNVGKPLLELGDDADGFSHRERGLREIGQTVDVFELDRRGIVDRLHQTEGIGGLAHRADHLVVPRMPDQNDRVTVAGEADRLAMHLRNQRTGGVDRF